ncbi:hypothetical protein SAMD00019534_115740 [Acytostelium subglobosum LB1]|uniref:hypothetical protein n=1 Tax=Acytostelium subglobosum LB1 TaxID=1410327 RepID=UPI000644ED96|nr:hypothetical protein SAMD00019534_115740 [Acytostelium subglobosum LB1]GAM28398.1 hypothetical protein SAMD00019534_115740 [Acytostelium subglobosum LB1]|eukprot:XP_012748715.1 hypothetical protein SAMD00019534_115740 [Acytostelium subglobosum LB1]
MAMNKINSYSKLLGAVHLMIFAPTSSLGRHHNNNPNHKLALMSKMPNVNSTEWSILLHKRMNSNFKDGQYGLVGGHLENGETIIEAGVREAKEEADLIINHSDLEIISSIHRHSGDREYIDFFVRCIHYQGEPHNMEPNKCSDLRFFPLNALPPSLIDHIHLGIHNSLNGVHFHEISKTI